MKTRQVQVTLLSVSLFAASTVLAQESAGAGSQAPAPSETPQYAVPSVESAAPPAATPAAPAAPALDERVAAVETKLAGTEETVGAMQASVDSFKKLKIGGFIQGRYEYHQDAVDGWSNYKNENRFYVRHGYLGARYEGKNAEYFLQIDANNNDGVVLKDAEASLVDTWTPLHLKLTLGQFKVPFGYEILQSDADREMPERAQVILSLFPGDRDRGLRLQGSYQMLRFNIAVVNGASFGQKDPSNYQGVVQNGYDPNGFKTVVGRVGADLGWLVGGVSGMWGRTLDTNVLPNPTTTPPTVASYLYYEQLRLGADVQGYVDVPEVGGLALKGELIWARKRNLDYDLGPANDCLDRRSLGWMITAVQNIGPYLGVALRFDQFDPLLSSTVDSRCSAAASPAAAIKNRDADRLSRLGVAVLLFASANIKFTLSYEHPWEQGPAVANDIVTAQLQARF
jgi:Phosphate-selective porin O and P